MKATVRHITSPDRIWDTTESAAEKNFHILVQIIVGPDDGPGEESFDVSVCDLDYLAGQLESEPIISGRHYLIVDRFDKGMIEGYLRRQVELIDESTWRDVAERMSRIGHWEFEDYKPYTPHQTEPL
jgi:Immunity protein 8